MDPITAIGAVASIVQLAQGALTLSVTLYGLGAAIISASQDLKNLADDLKTFSQSLTLLSRLLEDSKSWYSDDIYLLTAKVIQDCADLYIKIDVVLSKISRGGSTSWMKKMKYVMKESQIRKLLSRLRDLKGTLATILMSLQVDLQLSLLNVTTSSRLQRAPKAPLQPQTVQTLRAAQETVRKFRLLSIRATNSDGSVQAYIHEKSVSDNMNDSVVLQTSNSSHFIFLNTLDSGSPNLNLLPAAGIVNEQSADSEIVREVEGVLHSFRTALEVLEKVMKRIDEEDKYIRNEVDRLQDSLARGLDIKQAHGSHYRRHGLAYLKAFRDSQTTSRQLQNISTKLMMEVVTVLHVYSAAFEDLSAIGFQKLYSHSEKSRIRTLFELDRLAMFLFPRPLKLVLVSENLGGLPEPSHSEKADDEIHVSESDVDSRLSAAYDFLLRNIHPPKSEESGSIGHFSSLSKDQAFVTPQPHREPAETSHLPSTRSEQGEIAGVSWDSRASTLVPTERSDIVLPELDYATLSQSSNSGLRELGDTISTQLNNVPISNLDYPPLSALNSLALPTLGNVAPPGSSSFALPRLEGSTFQELSRVTLPEVGDIVTKSVTDLNSSTPEPPSIQPLAIHIPVIPSQPQQISAGSNQDMLHNTSGTVRELKHEAHGMPVNPVNKTKIQDGMSADDKIVDRVDFHTQIGFATSSYGGSRVVSKETYDAKDAELIPKMQSKRVELKSPRTKTLRRSVPESFRSYESIDTIDEKLSRTVATTTSRTLISPIIERPLFASAHSFKKIPANQKESGLFEQQSRSHENIANISTFASVDLYHRPRHESQGVNDKENRLLRYRDHENSSHVSNDVFSSPTSSDDEDDDGLFRVPIKSRQGHTHEHTNSERLWRSAALKLKDTYAEVFKSLNSILSLSVGFDILCTPGSEKALPNILLASLDTLRLGQDASRKLEDSKKTVESIIKVIQAVSGSLGLENSAPAWACVVFLLTAYDPVFSSPNSSTEDLTSKSLNTIRNIQPLTKSLAQLSNIVSMIARYAVMENLYENQAMAMTLRADYKSELVKLCTKILEWFDGAFSLAHSIVLDQDEVRTRGAADVSKQDEIEHAADTLWAEITEMDDACKKFAVAVIAVDDDRKLDDYEVEDVEEEEEDDDSDSDNDFEGDEEGGYKEPDGEEAE